MEFNYNIPDFHPDNFLFEIKGIMDDKIYSFSFNDSNLKVYTNVDLDEAEELILDGLVSAHDYSVNANGSHARDLRVYRALPKDQNPLISDFSILGFKKLSPRYDRGRKVKAEYKCPTKDEIIVEKIFTDVRDSNGLLEALEITFNWFDESNNIGKTKTETVKMFNKYQAETEERQRRERQLDFLIGSARGTPFESFIGALFLHYKAEIQNYKEEWDVVGWNTALDSETVVEILTILNTPFPTATNPYRANFVKDAIKYQIGVIDSAELSNREIDTPSSILSLLGL